MDISGEIVFGVASAALGVAVGYGILLARVDQIEKDLNNSRNIIERDVTNNIIEDIKEIKESLKQLNQDFNNLFNYFKGLANRLDLLEYWAEKQGYEKVPISGRFLLRPREEDT